MKTYFCSSTNLNSELQLAIFSLSLKLICSPAAYCKYGNNRPSATCKHTGQNVPTESKGLGFVEQQVTCKMLLRWLCEGEKKRWEGLVQAEPQPGRQFSGPTRWSAGSGASSCLAQKEPSNGFCEKYKVHVLNHGCQSIQICPNTHVGNQVLTEHVGSGVGGHAYVHTWEGIKIGLLWMFNREVLFLLTFHELAFLYQKALSLLNTWDTE